MSKIQVGAKVRVVSGGRYLGKEGIVKAVYDGNGSARIEGHFPRSANKTEQGFQLEHLKLLENAPGVVEMKAGGTIQAGDPVVAGTEVGTVVAAPRGGQHTHSTPMPTKADDAELAASEGDDRADPISAGPFATSAAVQSRPASTATAPSSSGSSLDSRLAARSAEQVVRHADTSPHLIVKARAGCLAADTILNINRGGKGSRMSIEKVVKQFNGTPPTYIRSDNGAEQRMRPWDLAIPTRIARAEGGVIKLATIKNAWFSGDKETFTLTTSTGRSIRATAIHPFLTNDGQWLRLEQVEKGHRLQVNSGRSVKGRGDKIEYTYTDVKFHPNKIPNGGGRFKVVHHRLVVEANMNGMNVDDFITVLRTDPETSATFDYLPRSTMVHHKDRNPRNNELSNLEVMADQADHSDEHEWSNNVLWQVGYEEVVSIVKYGVEPTYDIEVEDDPHNFLANGFVVHNTGKTTTLVHGVRRVLGLESDLIPSPQQAAVWEAMELSKGRAKTIAFCAFNKSIAEELKTRLPAGCEAATLHSLGFRVVKNAFGKVVSVNQYRVQNILSEIKGKDVFDIRRDEGPLLTVVDKLVSLCKMNLIDGSYIWVDEEHPSKSDEDQVKEWWTTELTKLISHYDIDTEGLRNVGEVFELVPQILERCKDVRRDNAIDYDDMIWLPVVIKLPVLPYDMLLVDEFQDLNRCQQALAKMYGRRIIGCGDDRQAIYGFAGADCESMNRMFLELSATDRGCIELPLTVTRRCGKAIVEEARKIVPDFEAFETNPEGIVTQSQYPSKAVPVEKSFMSRAADGDMVLCRCNAPLVSTCFKFLRLGRKAQIQGRDIGQGLISTVKKMKASSVVELQSKLDRWLHGERAKENAKRNPSEDKLIALEDRYDCLCAFMENAQTVDEVVRKIESVFTDQKDRPGVRLSSIHRAKGLEANRVFLLQLKKASVPHPMAKTEWGQHQEMNLKYVAVTRAIHELVIVTDSE